MSGPDFSSLSVADKVALREQLAARIALRKWHGWLPYPWQVCPLDEVPAHGMWLMLGGRGTGKTDGSARYVIEHVRGPACDARIPGGHRISIVAPTMGDAVESCINGPSGLIAHDPHIRMRSGVGGTHVLFPGGAEAKVFGAYTPEDVERLRSGGNRCLIWTEELAAMRRLSDVLHHTAFGLRIGPRPHYVASTTPKPRKELLALLKDPHTVVTTGRTKDAHHLDQAVRDKLFAVYAGTRLGRQELDGEVLGDVEGALWSWVMIDEARVVQAPELVKKVVAFDPAVTVTAESDESGIVCVGAGVDGEFYVLADRSAKCAGADAARRVWRLWSDLQANEVVWESNQGKRWVKEILVSTFNEMKAAGQIDAYGDAPLYEVHARVGKQTRAEPAAASYEQRRVHHVGAFAELEDQMTTWIPESGSSPDRVDALVYALARLDGSLGTADVAVLDSEDAAMLAQLMYNKRY